MNDVEELLSDHLRMRSMEARAVSSIDEVIAGVGSASSPADDTARRRWVLPAAASLVAILGVAAALTSRHTQTDPPAADAPDGPMVGDHWHVAYGFDLCGDWKILMGTQEETKIADDGTQSYVNEKFARTGFHSHGDGVIHVHPYTTAGTGDNATLGLFLDVYGVELTDDRLTFPGDQVDGRVIDEAVDTCGTAPAQLSVTVWPDASDPTRSTTFVDHLAGIRLADMAAITIAFEPVGTAIDIPTSAADLAELGATDGPSMPPDSMQP